VESETQDVERDLANASKLLAERSEIDRTQPQWLETRRQAREAKKNMAELSAPTADAASLHDRLMAIARECDVRVDRIQPSPMTLPPEPPPSDDPSAPPPVRPTAALANSIDVKGRYDCFVKFIDRLESLGFTRVNEVRIAPRQEGDVQSVQASVQTVHFAFASSAASKAQASAGAQGVTP
jgi:hypothetical protein